MALAPLSSLLRPIARLLGLCILAAVSIGLAGQPVQAQQVASSPEAGVVAHQYIGPDAYGAHAQNWGAAQDSSGVFYVANTEGVLAYDGTAWRTIPTANRSIARSVAANDEGRIFVGAQRDIGRIERDAQGQLHYVSLLGHVPPEHRSFTDVWQTQVTSDGIYFQAFRRLLRWAPDTQTIQVWAPDTRLQHVDVVRDTLYAHVEEQGLLAMRNDSLHLVPGGDVFADRQVRFVLPHDNGGLLVGTQSGLFVRDRDRFVRFETAFDASLRNALLYSAILGPGGSIAVFTLDRGIFLLEPDGSIQQRFAARGNPVTNMYTDREGGLWALLDGGMVRYDVHAPSTTYPDTLGLTGSVGDIVRHRDTLFLSTDRSVVRMQPSPSGPPTFESLASYVQSWSLLSVERDLLIGSSAGVDVRGPDGQIQRLFDAHHVYSLHRSAVDASRIYAATGRGVRPLTYDDGAPQARARWTVEPYLPNLNTEARTVAEADDGTLWVGTTFDGVYRVRFDAEDTTHVDHFGPDDGLPPDRVEPYRWNGRVVFGTSTGLLRFEDGPTPRFEPLSSVEMPTSLEAGKSYVRLQEDAQGRTWGRTGTGPGRWVQTDSTWSWAPGVLHRLQGRASNTIRTEDRGAVLWLGMDDGLVRFTPDHPAPPAPPPVRIQQAKLLMSDSLLTTGQPPPLDFTDNGLRIAYGTPSLADPEAVAYQHRLTGREADWSDWSARTTREMPNLSPGDYTFAVRARTAYGDTTQAARYAFTVRPPWYRTWWAYGLYALMGGGLVAGAVQLRTRHLRRRQRTLKRIIDARTEAIQEKNAQLATQAERLKELDQAKSRLFANVSHEFRTPLTVALGLLEDWTDTADLADSLQADLEQVLLQNRRVLRLVNQLLDIARLESQSLTLHVQPVALASFLERVAAAFAPLSSQQDVTFDRRIPADLGSVPADPEHLETVVVNLLSNAFKFTPPEGTITLTATRGDERDERDEGDETVCIQVADTGPGIPPEDHDAIFERFVQTQRSGAGGTGIGLALVKALTEQHGGAVSVESAEGEGTTFTIKWPRRACALPDEAVVVDETAHEIGDGLSRPNADVLPQGTLPVEAATDADAEDDASLPTVLIVDDNADIRAYVRRHLATRYHVIEAGNGQAGLEQARQHTPDCIVSDVMMPCMNGVAMLRALRDAPATDFIPVVLLTARAELDDKIGGLDAGADDYLTKPFRPRELRARIRTLLAQRMRLRERFQADPPAGPPPPDDTPPVVQKVQAVIHDHLADPDLSVQDIADALPMSRSTLYRRLRAVTEQSPSDLIWQVRLTKARELLAQGEGTVSEVAYGVGFKTVSHFSSRFQDHFGTPPSAIMSSVPQDA